jgi:hypothetical protein
MRNILRTVVLSALLTAGTSVFAQEKMAESITPLGKTIIKVNLTSLVFKNASLQIERVTSPKTSFALGVSYMPETGLPFASSLSEQFGDNADAQRAIETTRLRSFTITPEYRFYLSGHAPTGFYIAPFARYQNLYFQQEYSFTASSGKVHNPVIGGTINNIGGGILLGTQFKLGSKVTLDWWIAGPIYGTSSGNLSGTDDMSDLSAEDRANLEGDIEGVDIPLTKIDATVGNNRIDVKLDGPYAGLRAFGLALGIRF